MASRRITPTGWIRVATLTFIALICLASAVGWSDPDLWIPFVCIIAVMGVGTRGGMLDSLPFVLIEAAVVVVLGVATFSGSRDFIWAASVAISLIAVGKIALLEMTKELHEEEPDASPAPERVETPSPKTTQDDDPSRPSPP